MIWQVREKKQVPWPCSLPLGLVGIVIDYLTARRVTSMYCDVIIMMNATTTTMMAAISNCSRLNNDEQRGLVLGDCMYKTSV